jgi:hypothetical protein
VLNTSKKGYFVTSGLAKNYRHSLNFRDQSLSINFVLKKIKMAKKTFNKHQRIRFKML